MLGHGGLRLTTSYERLLGVYKLPEASEWPTFVVTSQAANFEVSINEQRIFVATNTSAVYPYENAFCDVYVDRFKYAKEASKENLSDKQAS